MLVRDADYADLPQIVELVNALLPTTTIEWTDTPHTLHDRERWLYEHRSAGDPVLVAERDGELAGFACYSDFRDTQKWPGYRYTVEHTIHVRERHWRGGAGRALIEALAQRALEHGKRNLVAAIDADNAASIAFHQRCGFSEVGRMPRVGWKLSRWLSLVWMQRELQPG